MNWGGIREAVRQAVASALGLEVERVQWMNNRLAGVWREFPKVDLQLRAPQAVGVDGVRWEYNAVEDRLLSVHEGPRMFTVSVRIETENQEDGFTAVGQLASDLRTRIRRADILEGLREAGVALSTILPTVDQDYVAEDRAVSLSVTDVVFLAAETDTNSVAAGDYIETVHVSSETLNGPGGDPTREQVDLAIPDPEE